MTQTFQGRNGERDREKKIKIRTLDWMIKGKQQKILFFFVSQHFFFRFFECFGFSFFLGR